MPKRVLTLVAAASLTAVSALAGTPAMAALSSVAIAVNQAPGSFTVGSEARTLSAVVATQRGGRCQRVRWAMAVSTEGLAPNQLRVTRVENGQPFGVRAEVNGDTARLVDADVDPGALCRDRTVTARWEIRFEGPDDGQATFRIGAFGADGRLLAATAVSRQVNAAAAPPPAATPPAATPAPSAATEAPTSAPAEIPPTEVSAEPATAETSVAPAAAAPTGPGGVRAAAVTRNAGGITLLGPGLIVGAVLIFAGVALLLRLWTRGRRTPDGSTTPPEAPMMTNGFYQLPTS